MLSHETVFIAVSIAAASSFSASSSSSSSSSSSQAAFAPNAIEGGRDGVAVKQLLKGGAEISVKVGVNNGVESRVKITDPKEKVDHPTVLAGDHFTPVEDEIHRVPAGG